MVEQKGLSFQGDIKESSWAQYLVKKRKDGQRKKLSWSADLAEVSHNPAGMTKMLCPLEMSRVGKREPSLNKSASSSL